LNGDLVVLGVGGGALGFVELIWWSLLGLNEEIKHTPPRKQNFKKFWTPGSRQPIKEITEKSRQKNDHQSSLLDPPRIHYINKYYLLSSEYHEKTQRKKS
jgi:hypothetical protein